MPLITKINDTELLDPSILEELLVNHIVESGGLPDPTSNCRVNDGLTYIDNSLGEICQPPYEFSLWVQNMFTAMRHDSRMLKALLNRVFSQGWMRGDKEILGVTIEALSDRNTGGLAPRLQLYLERFHPINHMARSMTHQVYREHLEYVPNQVDEQGGRKVVYWEVFHTPTGLVIEDFGLDSEEEATDFILQFPTIEHMNEKGELIAGR